MNLFPNRHAGKSRPYSRHETEIFDRAKASSAHALIASFPGYAVTPLHALRDLASELGLGSIQIKDKSGRFGLGSFKALGGAYAVFLLEQKAVSAAMQRQACVEDMKSAAWHEVAAGITVACTTDGNHGRSVAAGCRFVIFLHRHVSPVREQAIRDQGADIVHVDGNYDDAVAEADRTSARMGWHMVSDTSYEGYVRVPSDIMHGYAVMMEEIYAQTGAPAPDAARQPFTHVFLQAGAVGMAAAVAASLWQALGEARPTIVMVEPEAADCLYQSARAGLPAPASGDIDSTAMAILA
ncbi:MAG: diaminopropionate ammonia-lyase [Candidatus Protistobacter heckmanni]|nr:diaminopropionate ammonia-lyase [Candidatus Protistobacter heckmanni]